MQHEESGVIDVTSDADTDSDIEITNTQDPLIYEVPEDDYGYWLSSTNTNDSSAREDVPFHTVDWSRQDTSKEDSASDFSDFNLVKAFSFLTYATIKLLQTFTYAWYGTVLTNAGEDFREGIYFGEWPSSDLGHHVRTNIILMMMQKPTTVNAFFSPVDIVIFTNFVNTTMSYFFLLRSVGVKGG
ncbi:PREDICTED: uncharacterized protein LOC105449466 [Wasmannia auropunctata]|uniref:uncharacterized protein LOC105449466 n=1 Tax=Wasmannia auropunctata TaxID=64793 RepID=UPI0005EE48B8|nr:PREDICTED: uncharacterized protein LOC105449466 [Wasmannia auropunctata]